MSPDCMQCKYFKVTWDKAAPRGCEGHGFKTRAMPSTVVLESSGSPCELFQFKVDLGQAQNKSTKTSLRGR